MIELRITGVDEVTKALTAMTEKTVRKESMAALREVADPILRAAQERVPARYGLLRKALNIRAVKRRTGLDVASIGVNPKIRAVVTRTNPDGTQTREHVWPFRYAHLVERGTKPHLVRAKGKALTLGPVTVSGSVQHPGARPQPFMRPAYDQYAPGVPQKYMDYLWRRIRGSIR
jgi:HK97 gp10 family phage protein